MLQWRVMKSFEKLGAQRPENPEEERISTIRWLAKVNPALIPAALAATISAGEVTAESIEEINGQNWLQGVDTLRESVMSAETEVGATFVIGEDGKQYWYSTGKGETRMLHSSAADIKRQLEHFTEEAGEEVDRFCTTHTHNLKAMTEVGYISNDELAQFQSAGYGPSAPPSLEDIDSGDDYNIRSTIRDIPYFNTVFDAQGIWYSRMPTDADYDAFPTIREEIDRKNEAQEILFGNSEINFAGGVVNESLQTMETAKLEELLAQFGSDWGRKNVEDVRERSPEKVRNQLIKVITMDLVLNDDANNPLISEVLPTSSNQDLYQTYLGVNLLDKDKFYTDVNERWIEASKDGEIDESLIPEIYEAFIRQGALVRFVPYDQVPNEPPCAGPDYKPE